MTKEDFHKATDPTDIILTGSKHGITHYEITCDMNWMLFDSLDKMLLIILETEFEDALLSYEKIKHFLPSYIIK